MFYLWQVMTTEQNAESSSIDLKTVRENSGLTLKEMFERTRISVLNLEAIENGDFHLIPVPIYARNFIKTYADALGVDSKPILQRYETYLQALQMKEKAQKKEESQNESVGIMMSRYKAYFWICSIIVVVVAVSIFVSVFNKPETEGIPIPEIKKEAPVPAVQLPMAVLPENKPAMDLPAQQEITAVLTQAPPEAKPKEAKPLDAKSKNPAALPPAVASAPVQKSDAKKMTALLDNEEASIISIRASEETWIRIQADDKEPFQVLLKAGEKMSHKGARFNMDIGNAAGVKIFYNGKTFENLGKTGQVIHLRLP